MISPIDKPQLMTTLFRMVPTSYADERRLMYNNYVYLYPLISIISSCHDRQRWLVPHSCREDCLIVGWEGEGP
jgi:hypothetical protein